MYVCMYPAAMQHRLVPSAPSISDSVLLVLIFVCVYLGTCVCVYVGMFVYSDRPNANEYFPIEPGLCLCAYLCIHLYMNVDVPVCMFMHMCEIGIFHLPSSTSSVYIHDCMYVQYMHVCACMYSTLASACTCFCFCSVSMLPLSLSLLFVQRKLTHWNYLSVRPSAVFP
jgi:hypothetical protein